MKSRLILLCFLFYSSFSFSQQFRFNRGLQGISLPELQKQLKDFTDTAETTKAKKDAEGNVISQAIGDAQLCVIQEFVLRYFNVTQKDDKKWFLTPEQAIYFKLYKVFV